MRLCPVRLTFLRGFRIFELHAATAALLTLMSRPQPPQSRVPDCHFASRFPDCHFAGGNPGMHSIHPHKCHLCGWIERIPGGTRQNDGQEIGIMGACSAVRANDWPSAGLNVPKKSCEKKKRSVKILLAYFQVQEGTDSLLCTIYCTLHSFKCVS